MYRPVEEQPACIQGLVLKEYQLQGVNWVLDTLINHHRNCILGDEMGLGKTIQSITVLSLLQGACGISPPYLVVAPLTLVDNWRSEFERFCPSLRVETYLGDKQERLDFQKRIVDFVRTQPKESLKDPALPFDVLVTTYDYIIKDEDFLRRFSWRFLVVDEAHRLKNDESVLYQRLFLGYCIPRVLLLTGTPLQNNMVELWCILHFLDPRKFPNKEIFLSEYSLDKREVHVLQSNASATTDQKTTKLRKVLQPYLLRRTHSSLGGILNLPPKAEFTLRAPLTPLQRRLYKAILRKDIASVLSGKQGLMNVVMQLRKCCNHPYLFDGVEPEPFQLGEHLVEASSKLILLDKLLTRLKRDGNKVLIFSQMTAMLDIIQDFMDLRNFQYERLDGSVRGEDRFLAISNFTQKRTGDPLDADASDPFAFLLSTRAGGVGLNLVVADTVIFFDCDWNPQMDLQAQMRVHRIGQTRPVRVFRLIGKDSVDEVILQRAAKKMALTRQIIESGNFSNTVTTADQQQLNPEVKDLKLALSYGLDVLFSSEEKDGDSMDFSVLDEDIDKILSVDPMNWGTSSMSPPHSRMEVDGEDQSLEQTIPISECLSPTMDLGAGGLVSSSSSVPQSLSSRTMNVSVLATHENGASEEPNEDGCEDEEVLDLYQFQGEDYRSVRQRKKRDDDAFENLLKEAVGGDVSSSSLVLTDTPKRSVRTVDPDRVEANRKRLAEAQLAKQEATKQRKLERWAKKGYVSMNLPSPEDLPGEGSSATSCSDAALHHVTGDVLEPSKSVPVAMQGRPMLILHYLDDSGSWGNFGLNNRIETINASIPHQYTLAKDCADLHLGDAHVCEMAPLIRIAILIVQKRSQNGQISEIVESALEQALNRVQAFALTEDATVHTPRFGGRNCTRPQWYKYEKLLKKHLVSRGVDTFLYYFPRKNAPIPCSVSPTSPSVAGPSTASSSSTSPPTLSSALFGDAPSPPFSSDLAAGDGSSLAHSLLQTFQMTQRRPGQGGPSQALPPVTSSPSDLASSSPETDFPEDLFDDLEFQLSQDMPPSEQGLCKEMILGCGGTVLRNGGKDTVLVVSSAISGRSSSGGPCVSVQWLKDCVSQRRLLSWDQ